jgi:endonuclease/exonuclease/phosphatase family metal-dependent hydrolase
MLLGGCAEDLFSEGADHSNWLPSFDSDSTFSVITWNIENFAKHGDATVNFLASSIDQLNADVICLQEIKDENDFQELVNRLENYSGHRENSAAYNLDLAVLYLNDLDIISIDEIYTDDWWSFPRSPQVIQLLWHGHEIILINNHYKANENDTNDDENRRISASQILDEYVVSNFPFKNVIILGDLNDDLTEPVNDNVFSTFISKTEEYLFVDMNIAAGTASNWSFPTWPSHLDHILITNELFDEFENFGSSIQTIKIEDYLDGGWNEYEAYISDHRPVGLRLVFDP